MTASIVDPSLLPLSQGVEAPDWLEIPPVEVPLDRLGFLAEFVRVDGILKHAAERTHGFIPVDHYPRYAWHNGRPWVLDGNHRTLVAIARGDQTILARVRPA